MSRDQQHMRLSKRLKISLCLVVSACTFSVWAESGIAVNCGAELDAAVTLASYSDHDPDALARRFAALENHCPAFAQMAHNQGVLAAQADNWPQAIAHFKRSLSADRRAADTHRHLKQIYEYQAAQAYAKALDTPMTRELPRFAFQDSNLKNAEAAQDFPPHAQLRDVATIEYELYAWWQAHQTSKGIRQHYVDNYNTDAIKLSGQEQLSQPWSDTRREITFAASDAVVILSDALKAHTLLLMRLEGTRWKIYQETRL